MLACLAFTLLVKSICAVPNFVIFHVDDLVPEHGDWGIHPTDPAGSFNEPTAVSSTGESLTPNIDKIREEGVTFSRAYTASPMCAPSRTALLTGRYPSQSAYTLEKSISMHGYDVNPYVTVPTSALSGDEITNNVAALLQRNGYRTGMMGKWHLTPSGEPGSDFDAEYADQVAAVEARGFDYVDGLFVANLNECGQCTFTHNLEWMEDKAFQFMQDSVESGEPFLMYFNPTTPHTPNVYTALDGADPADTPNGTQSVRAAADGYMMTTAQVRAATDSSAARGTKRGAVAGAVWLDSALGGLYQKLEEMEILNSTVVIVLSDNGAAKGDVYEMGARVPMFMRYPPLAAANTQVPDVVCNMDITPTIAELAGITPDYTMYGKSLKSLLESGAALDRDYIVSEIAFDRAVVTDQYKYIHKPQGEYANSVAAWVMATEPADVYPSYSDEEQLYDLAADDAEQVNLASSMTDVVATMRSFLAEHEALTKPSAPAALEWTTNTAECTAFLASFRLTGSGTTAETCPAAGSGSERKFCMACRLDDCGSVVVDLYSNNLADHNYRSSVAAQDISLTIPYKPRPDTSRATDSYTGQYPTTNFVASQADLDLLQCEISSMGKRANGKNIGQDADCDGDPDGRSTSLSTMTGLALNGVAIFSPVSADVNSEGLNMDPFYPSNNGEYDADFVEAIGLCLAHPNGQGVLHYHSMSPCMCGDAQCSTFDADVSAMDQSESCAQNALCSGTASDGRDNAAMQWALYGTGDTGFQRSKSAGLKPIGLALDGYPIYGPYDENGDLHSGLDVCNGKLSEDGTEYAYYATQQFPYLVGCFGPGPYVDYGPSCSTNAPSSYTADLAPSPTTPSLTSTSPTSTSPTSISPTMASVTPPPDVVPELALQCDTANNRVLATATDASGATGMLIARGEAEGRHEVASTTSAICEGTNLGIATAMSLKSDTTSGNGFSKVFAFNGNQKTCSDFYFVAMNMDTCAVSEPTKYRQLSGTGTPQATAPGVNESSTISPGDCCDDNVDRADTTNCCFACNCWAQMSPPPSPTSQVPFVDSSPSFAVPIVSNGFAASWVVLTVLTSLMLHPLHI